MKGFSDVTVSNEQYKQIQEQIVITARRTLVGRKVIGVAPPAGLGVQTFTYDKLTELADAGMAFEFFESQDAPAQTRTNVPVPILQRDFKLHERDVLSSHRYGTPLDTMAINSAAYKVAYLEDTLILKGSDAPDISGLYDGAGNSETTSKDFATFGNATDKVEAAIALLTADNIEPPYNMVLNVLQATQLKASISSTGVRELPIIIDLLGGGEVIQTNAQTVATGMLLAANGRERGMFEYRLAQDFTSDLEKIAIASGGGWKGKVFVAGVPIIYDSDAICTLTNI